MKDDLSPAGRAALEKLDALVDAVNENSEEQRETRKMLGELRDELRAAAKSLSASGVAKAAIGSLLGIGKR